MPLFSPVYTSTRPYSQTKSNTQRDLMQPDEVLRLERQKCIALFQGHKPALLYKLTPEELPDYSKLESCRVIDYVPEWKRREEATDREMQAQAAKAPPPPPRQSKVSATSCEDRSPAPPNGAVPPGLTLPPKHFFAARQADGPHRFYGSEEP